MTAADRKTFIEYSLHFHRNIPPQTATPSMPAFALEAIRLAGSRRLRPVVPDRTAFGAAIEGETQRDHAENQCQSPEHGRATPHSSSYDLKSGIFKPRRASVHFRQMHLRMAICIRARNHDSCNTNHK